jgi:hypothetical protein
MGALAGGCSDPPASAGDSPLGSAVALRVQLPGGNPSIVLVPGSVLRFIAQPVGTDSAPVAQPVDAAWTVSDTTLALVDADGTVTVRRGSGDLRVMATYRAGVRTLSGAKSVMITELAGRGVEVRTDRQSYRPSGRGAATSGTATRACGA